VGAGGLVNHLVFAAEWKAAADSGELDGYMSVFDVIDDGGDVVQRGAFKATFDAWSRAKTPMPLTVNHELTTDGIVGAVTNMAEDGYGARIRARFSSVPRAQDVRQKMLDGVLSGLSFTYNALRHRPGMKDGRTVRVLEEIRVLEATITPFPMNRLAVASAKGGGVDDVDDAAQLDELEAELRAAIDAETVYELASAPSEVFATIAEAKSRAEVEVLERDLVAWGLSLPQSAPEPDRRPLSPAEVRYRADADRAFFSSMRHSGCGTCPACRVGRSDWCLYH
jgi:HK97 family phage prohead protease